MADMKEIASQSKAVCALLRRKFGVPIDDLTQAQSRLGRRLPRRVRVHLEGIIDAERLSTHPKLRRQVDMAAVQRSHQQILRYLKTVDPADRRRGQLLALAGAVAFNLLFIIAAFITWLWWRGYL
ncbi:MAG: hypothetical protein AAF755_03805 [Pseudomonadota bacterium]